MMNLYGAVEIAETEGSRAPEPQLPDVVRENIRMRDVPVQAGRVRESGGGASFFVW
jgi:hypothetical protein